MVAVDVQLASTHTDWPMLREASVRAERAGFDALWVYDHIAGVPLGGQHAVQAQLESRLDARHVRVVELLDLTDEMWHDDRADPFASFALPDPVPPRIVGAGLLDEDHPTRREMDDAGLDRIILVVIDDVEEFAGQL